MKSATVVAQLMDRKEDEEALRDAVLPTAVGNPHHNAQAESFMKTLKVEDVYPTSCETFADVAKRLFID